jgi:uncharacterized protein
MYENLFFSFIIFVLVTIQSVVGIGVLVIGTPLLLLLQINIIEILSILLPISIITSFFNFFFIRLIKKKTLDIDKSLMKKFFFICAPSIFIGLILLNNFETLINFKYLVSFVIIISILLTYFLKERTITNKFKTIFLILVGLVHGLTNSGGTLLSLLLSSSNERNHSRYNITFFYLLLASFQYIIFLIIFDNHTTFNSNFHFFISIFSGLIMGNILFKFFNDKFFKILIKFLAILTSLFLMIN